MRFLVALLMFSSACATTQANTHPPLVAESRRPEVRDLPVAPDDRELPDGIPAEPGEDAVFPIEEGDEVVMPGILVSEARAARDALYRIDYTELRRMYEADRQVWEAHRALYEEQIRRDREALEEAQPGWWERHDATVVGVVAFLLGAAITTGIVAAIDKVTE